MTASDMDSVARVLTFETPARRPGGPPLPTPTPIVGRGAGGATPPVARSSPQAAKAGGAAATPQLASKGASPSLLLRRVSFGNQGAAPTPLSASRQPVAAPAASAGASGGSRPASSFRAPSSSSSDDDEDDGDYEVDYDYAQRLWSGESRPWAPVARPVPLAAAVPRRSAGKGGGKGGGAGGGQAPSYSVPYSSSEDDEGAGDENMEVSSVWRQQQRSGGARGGPMAASAAAARGRPPPPFGDGGGETTGVVVANDAQRHPHHHHHHHHRLISEEAPELSLVEAAATAAAAAAAALGGVVSSSSSRRQQQPPPPPIHPVDPVRLALAGRAREVQRAASAIAASDASRLQASLAGEAARLEEGLRRLAVEAGGRAADLSASELSALDAREGLRARAQDDLRREHAAASAAYTAALERSAAAAAAAAAVERRKAAERAAAEAEAERRRRAQEEQQQQQQQQQQEQQRQQQQAAAAAAAAEARVKAERESALARAQQEQQQQQQQAAAATAAAAAATAAAAAAPKPGAAPSSGKGPFPVRAGKAALERAAELSRLLADAEAACSGLQESADPSLKRERRALERRITVLVSQVSGTQAQVAARAGDLASVLLGAPERGGARLLACLALASRLLSQCEGQVATIPSFAFPLAFVACRVGCRVPHFFDLLSARLQRACPMLVPVWSAYTKSCAERGLAREDHQRAIGFKSVDWVGGDAPPPGADGEPPKRLETSDEFTARQSGYVAFYAALLQCDANPEAGSPAAMGGGGGGGGGSSVFGAPRRAAGPPSAGPPPLPPSDLAPLRAHYGLPGAWAYVARVLNHVPASRTSAAALMAFLNTAGYSMHAAYGGQFVKMLHSLYDGFLPDLAAHGDPDARAVGTRLRTYLERAQYREVPEGRELPLQDESSYTRAT